MKTGKKADSGKSQKGNLPTSRRICEVGGKRFSIIRHFEGEQDLRTLMTEIAISRADREMCL